MKVIESDIWLCPDCLQAAVNDDNTGLDYHYNETEADQKLKDINEGLERLGPNLVPDFYSEDIDPTDIFKRDAWVKAVTEHDEDGSWLTWAQSELNRCGYGTQEFSTNQCDCCLTYLAGTRHRFAILGPEEGEHNDNT